MTLVAAHNLDVKFWVYSKRKVVKTASGTSIRVYEPRPLYAQSAVLKSTEYFRDLLREGFAESSRCTTLWSSFPSDEEEYSDNYDYECDSDLEDDFDDDDYSCDARVEEVEPRKRSGSADDAPVSLATGLITPPYDSTSPVISERALGDQTPLESEGAESSFEVIRDTACHEVVIRDAAYTTWRALLYYLHKGEVKFYDPYAQPVDDITHKMSQSTLGSVPETWETAPVCSPKSMYRLAEKLGLTALEKLSLQGIHDSLTPSTILDEVFSEFTSLYPPVLQMEIQYLCRNYNHPKVAAGWDDVVDAFSRGESQHATSVMLLLLKETLVPKTQPNRLGPRLAPSIGRMDSACYPPGIGLSSF